MSRLLFVCLTGEVLGPTAAQVFAEDGHATDFGGFEGAGDRLSAEQIDWAERIFALEPRARQLLQARFSGPMRGKRVVALTLSAHYSFMDPGLVRTLRDEAGPHLDTRHRP